MVSRQCQRPDGRDLPEFAPGAHVSVKVPNGALRKVEGVSFGAPVAVEAAVKCGYGDFERCDTGWEAAGGVDYRFNSIWHVSGQFRYGTNRAASKAHNPNATFLVPTTSATSTPLGVTGSNSASRKEEHWLADFMVGRDMNIGMGSSQVKFGIRVASIKGTTTGSAAWNVPTTTATTTTAVHRRSYAQSSTFVGVGPRLAIEGSVPLGGGWSFDYNGGIAALVGDRKLSQHVTLSGANVNPCLAGCPVTGTSVSNGTVFNLDVQPALAYAIDRTWKASVSYRFDGYWNAMRTYDANSNQVNVDRFYQGAFLRLTATR